MQMSKAERRQCYVALLLTVGEFGAAVFLVVHDGHILAAYLAVTYLMRETSGGKHYHEIVLENWQRVRKLRVNKGAGPTPECSQIEGNNNG